MNKKIEQLTNEALLSVDKLDPQNMHTIGMIAMLNYLQSERKTKFLKSILLIFAFGVLPIIYITLSWLWWDKLTSTEIRDQYISLVRLEGKIVPRSSLSSLVVNKSLDKAFSDSKSKGVVLLINSPGGTPVQSSEIYTHLMQLKLQYPDKKLVVLGQDIMTSGAFLVAMAADNIYVNSSTITGSIGVIMSHYNFSSLAKRFGIYKNIITAGKYKLRFDPLLPSTKESRAKFQSVLNKMHNNFIRVVKNSRGSKLNAKPAILFSGDIWTGKTAVKMGLVDGLSNLRLIMKSNFNVDHYRDYTAKKTLISSLAESIRASVVTSIHSSYGISGPHIN